MHQPSGASLICEHLLPPCPFVSTSLHGVAHVMSLSFVVQEFDRQREQLEAALVENMWHEPLQTSTMS